MTTDMFDRVKRLVCAATGDEWGDGSMVTDVGIGIAEPGYPTDAIWVAGNWNPKRFPRANEPKLTKAENLAPRLADALERRVPGIELLWLDEWMTCDECRRAIRSEPDSYGWLPSYMYSERGTYCLEHIEWEDIKAEYVNEPTKALTFPYDLAAQGFERYVPSSSLPGHWDNGRFESGWHNGQDGDPKQVFEQARADGWADGIFAIPFKGQFDITFELWVRAKVTDTCQHCQRPIAMVEGAWIDPEATGDDSFWRETCDDNDTWSNEHKPED